MQRQNKSIFLFLVFAFLFNFSFAATQITTTTKPSPSPPSSSPSVSPTNTIQKVFTLKELSSSEGFLLSGANATKIVYLPLPQQWTLNNVSLHLFVYSSSLLGSPSSLTAYIDGNPINAIRLDGHYNTNLGWDFTIPADLLTGKVITLTFNNIIDNYGYSCYNLSSPQYWAYIAGSSTVTYSYSLQDYQPDLIRYPFPFINDSAIQKDTVIIVFPDAPSFANDAALFYIANSLQKASNWLGVNLIAKTVSHLTNEDKQNNHLIYVGTIDELHLSNGDIKWPLNIQSIAADTGVIMLVQSPWNPTKALLAITGNTDQAIVKAADALRNPTFTSTVLFNQYALITQDNHPITDHLDWTDTTLEDLNYSNEFLYGTGANAINYDVDLPINRAISGLDLVIDYAITPFLSKKDNSYLTLRVNDAPIDGITLSVGSSKIKRWKIHIDKKNLYPGKNRLSFLFNLTIDNNHCKPGDVSLAWGTIFNSSTLTAHFDSNDLVFLNFKILKASADPLLISIPANNPYFQSEAFAQQVLNLSKTMPLVSDVSFLNNESLNADILRNKNLIYIGDLKDSKMISSMMADIPFYFNQNHLYIDPRLKSYLAISNELPISINEVITSPFNQNRMIMLLLADSADHLDQGLILFTDAKKGALVEGSAVLAYANGTFTSVDADKIISIVQRKESLKRGLLYYIVGIGILIILIIIGLRIYKKLKIYLSPKQ